AQQRNAAPHQPAAQKQIILVAKGPNTILLESPVAQVSVRGYVFLRCCSPFRIDCSTLFSLKLPVGFNTGTRQLELALDVRSS
ncbi:unnamed protein product, partial [Scytosiphon promiscuus]